ncbi:uncharacterized protein LOC119616518 [Lucilia sericata]|uniref:uncharacterized protein LOC119616518 n=1 Tax=Lucilia sericata TaxID=13632 RepID=UPI0018A86938|nr:uncharacterized protein LOC119616518 [Lucilia sericata]
MKIILHLCLLFTVLNVVLSQIFYPAIRVHQFALLQNGNVTVVPFIERASPAPLVPRDARGRRLVMAATQATPAMQSNNTSLVPSNNNTSALLVPQYPGGADIQLDVRGDV